ncbi:triphosphoribosyl-dephospho-CoA synthase [bacterium]|nr:triphosphoribosyl-dephospho-CoA synthase [bacterium]
MATARVGEEGRFSSAEAILAAKERRWERKLAMAEGLRARGLAGGASLAAITLRMPAALRTSGACLAEARELHADFAGALAALGAAVLEEEFRVGADGPESFFAVELSAEALKRAALSFEEEHPFGELADVDVMDSDGAPVGRAALGLPPRRCLVCGGDAAECVVGRRHSPEETAAAAERILLSRGEAGAPQDRRIAAAALSATLLEASASPKPGLVSPGSRGAHRDMEYATFLASAAALAPWFLEFARLGRRWPGPAGGLMPSLRAAGKAAEADMFAATGGVNTHKGLIFSMGLLCAAAGRLWAAGRPQEPRACADEAAAIAAGVCDRDFSALAAPAAPGSPTIDGGERPRTAGERLYQAYGVRGIRGEAEAGFPSALEIGLPRLRAGLAAGRSIESAMIDALLALCESVEDTNVLGRAGPEGLSFLRREAGKALALGGAATPEGLKAISALDAELVARNISPGGCADLLAVTVFLGTLA